jgi:hypothetical protein
MRFLASLAATLLIAANAAAEDAADVASSQVELIAAANAAKAFADQRWAFTMTYTDLLKQETWRVRFDPRLPAGKRWTPLNPPADALTKEERKAMASISRNDDADESLVYDGLAEAALAAKLLRADAKEAVFAIDLSDPDMSAEMKSALSATATLDRERGHVSAVEIVSMKPFKPAAVAKIETMRQLQRYAPVGPDGLALLVASDAEARGSAMFKAFEQKTSVTYSDFEAVDAPPRAEED